MISVLNNMGGLRSMDALQQNHVMLQSALERLSTGIRINRAEDDAAGLLLRDRFQAQVTGLEEGIRNIQTAQGMVQVAEQGLNKVTEALQQMRALAVRAADDNLNDEDRGRIQQQVKGLLREINERAATTSYNGRKLLDGSVSDSREERRGSAKVQGNAFLADGASLVAGASTTGDAARRANAISQGSYEVRLVFSGEQAVRASATSLTTLRGRLNSGANGDGVTDVSTLTQVVTDRNLGAHTATITLTQTGDGSRKFGYSVNVAGGGVYGAAQAFTGTLEFNDDGSLKRVDNGGSTRSVKLSDGTAGGQAWTLDFAGLVENQHATAGAAASATDNGAAGVQSTFIPITNTNLSSSNQVGDSYTTAEFQAVDRTGATHSLSITFTKTGDSPSGDEYTYSINGLSGGVWDSDNSGNTSGTLVFDPTTGLLSTVNGGPSPNFDIRVGDGTSNGQDLFVVFAGLNVNGVGNTAAFLAPATPGSPTTDVQVRNNLVNGTSPAAVSFSVVDRTGMDTSSARITFSQTSRDSKTWSYTIAAPSTSGFNTFGSNLQGEVRFDDAGNLVALDGGSSLAKMVTFGDGTAEGQRMRIDFSQLNMAAGDDFSSSLTDGGAGTDAGEVNAVIYYSDGSGKSDVNPVSTLYAVDRGARSYAAGGVRIDLARASTLDIGLNAYVKAYTYVSATREDRSLTFQVGADEGYVNRLGIGKMDVQSIFRRNGTRGGSSSYTDIDLSDALKAQDLIGQIDDALNYVGGENLKVGMFGNKFSRTLDIARTQMTAMSGALSNLNDADMALEATKMSKRSILVQSATAMVAQANAQGQFILQLLR